MIFRPNKLTSLSSGVDIFSPTNEGSNPAFVGPYDGISDIVGLYGMRRLRSAYTGPILRIRRSSDSTEMDIGYLANGDLDAAALASFIGAGTGYVKTWYDQSGLSNHATQTTSANQGEYISQASGIYFDGSNDYLETPILAEPTASVQVKFNTHVGSIYLFGADNNVGSTRLIMSARSSVSSTLRRYGWAGIAQNGTGAQADDGIIGLATYTTGAIGYFNGVADGTLTSTWSGTGLAMYIGTRNTTSGPGSPQKVRISEVFISDVTYDATQMAAIAAIMA